MISVENEWWAPEYDFFGKFYIEGDDSIDGYRQEIKQTLNERIQSEVDGVVNLLQFNGGKRILDVPCGYGRHSIGLAKKGYSVVGYDINPTHLNYAINKSKEDSNLDLSFFIGNMLNFKADGKFDAVINMFYSFGFFENEDDNFATLLNFYEHLNYGGKFLFHTDVSLKRVISGKYKEYEERILSSGKILKVIDKYDPVTKRMNGQWVIGNEVDEVVKSYSVKIYSDEDFIEMCKKANFRKIDVFGDWDGSAYTEDSEDMIVVAEK